MADKGDIRRQGARLEDIVENIQALSKASARDVDSTEGTSLQLADFPAANDDAVRLAARMLVTRPNPSVITFMGIDRDDPARFVSLETVVALARIGAGAVLFVDLVIDAHTNPAHDTKRWDLEELLVDPSKLNGKVGSSSDGRLSILSLSVGKEFKGSIEASLAGLFDTFRERYRFAVVHCPPILEYGALALVAARSDAVVMVLRARAHARPDVERLRDVLNGLGVQIFGAVLHDRPKRRRSRGPR